MLKKVYSLMALIAVLALAGCGSKTSETDERTNFAYMMGEITCATMEDEDGSFSDDDAQAIAEKYGFGDWTEDDLNNYIDGLTTEQNDEVSGMAVTYINDNCLPAFEAYGIEPETMIEFMMTSDY